MQFDFQLAAVPLPDQPGKYFLLKHISFSEQVKIEFPKTLCHGDCLCVQWQGHNKNIRKALQYMFDNMGGFQIQSFALSPAGAASSDRKTFYDGLSDDKIDEGFDFIEQYGPRSHHSNTQLRWITKQLISEGSPIKDWPERLIKEADVPMHPKASSVVHLLGHQEQICFQYICFFIKDNSHIQTKNCLKTLCFFFFFWGGSILYIYIYI